MRITLDGCAMRPTNARHDYRPEVDGLRTIAVLSVCIFHIWPTALPGGFLGVDVFFVISGYLISRIIFREMDSREFSLSSFYLRRIRRILPAQFFVTAVCLIGFYFLLSPTEYSELGEAAFYSAFSLSNIYFWLESGYFGALTDVSPLLHMWSLGVEEQFYLIWPALLIFIASFSISHVRVAIFLAAFIFSLLSVVALNSTNSSAAFYLFPFRVFEFLCGGAIAIFSLPALKRRVANVLSVVGASAVIASLFAFNSNILHPGVLTLLPCIGAGLLIYSTQFDNSVQKILSTRPMVHLGLLSYSLYLTHWPIIVAAKLIFGDTISFALGLSLLILTYLSAFIMHNVLEKPLRYGRIASLDIRQFRLLIIFMLFISVNFAAAQIWHNKPIDEDLQFAENIHRKSNEEAGEGSLENCPAKIERPDEILDCHVNVLVIGDSHAGVVTRAMRNYFRKTYSATDIVLSRWTTPGCPPLFGVVKLYDHNVNNPVERCQATNQAWETNIPKSNAEIVVIAARWAWLTESDTYFGEKIRKVALVRELGDATTTESSQKLFKQGLARTVDVLQASDKRILLVGQVPIQPRSTIRCLQRRLAAAGDVGSCSQTIRTIAENRLMFSNSLLEELAAENQDVFFLNAVPAYCDENICSAVESGRLLYSDNTHLNNAGTDLYSRHFAPKISFFLSGGDTD